MRAYLVQLAGTGRNSFAMSLNTKDSYFEKDFLLRSIHPISFGSVIVNEEEASKLTEDDLGKMYDYEIRDVKMGTSVFTQAFNLKEIKTVDSVKLNNN